MLFWFPHDLNYLRKFKSHRNLKHCLSLLDSWQHENAVVNQSFICFIDLIRRIHKFLTQSLTSAVIKSILSSY